MCVMTNDRWPMTCIIINVKWDIIINWRNEDETDTNDNDQWLLKTIIIIINEDNWDIEWRNEYY